MYNKFVFTLQQKNKTKQHSFLSNCLHIMVCIALQTQILFFITTKLFIFNLQKNTSTIFS